MGQPRSIRLGGVEVTYDPRTGLSLQDAHRPDIPLVIYESDLPAFFKFMEEAQSTTLPPKPAWDSAIGQHPADPQL